MKKIIYLLLILCLFSCYKENDNNYVFLAKDAYFYNCQVFCYNLFIFSKSIKILSSIFLTKIVQNKDLYLRLYFAS